MSSFSTVRGYRRGEVDGQRSSDIGGLWGVVGPCDDLVTSLKLLDRRGRTLQSMDADADTWCTENNGMGWATRTTDLMSNDVESTHDQKSSHPAWQRYRCPSRSDGVPATMSERDDRLHQFFAGYFHQDWNISGAATWSDVMDEYLSQNRSDDAIRTRDSLRSWLAEAGPDQLPATFGCDYDPSADGMDQRTRVDALADYIERKGES